MIKIAFDSRITDENKAKIRLSDMLNIPDDSIDYAVMDYYIMDMLEPM